MNVHEKELLHVVDRLYATALGEESWCAALKCLGDLFGGAGAGIVDLDRRTGSVGDFFAYGFDDEQVKHIVNLSPINPRIQFSSAAPIGHVAWEGRFITEREMDRHAFYDALDTVSGFRYFLGSRLQERGSISTYTALHFTARHGHPSDDEIETYGLLTRHISNAWSLGRHADAAGAHQGLPPFLSERVPWGVITLADDGHILAMNSKAERVMASHDGLGVRDDQVYAWKSAENRALQVLIGDGIRSANQGTLASGGALAIARPSGLAAYILQVIPNIRAVADHASPTVVIHVSDPNDVRKIPSEQLATIFGLSRKEAVLAGYLACGKSLVDAAEQMQISYNTARNHLQSIFRKTSTNSQVNLVRVLGQLVASEDNGAS